MDWKDATTPQMVNGLRRDRRHAPAIVFRDRTTSFGEMADLADRISAYLVTAGLAPGDRVVVLLPPSETWASIHYGVIGAGCLIVPINLAFKDDELRFVLKQSQARCIIAADTHKGDDLGERLEQILPALAAAEATGRIVSSDFPTLERAVLVSTDSGPRGSWRPANEMLTFAPTGEVRDELDRRQEALKPDQSCAIVYTSGSTSFPKPALLHHRGLMSGAWWYGVGSDIRPDERILGFAPTFHVSGISGMMVPHLRGLPIWLLDGFEPGAALDLIEKERITMFSGFDTMFVSLLRHPAFTPDRVKSVRSLRMATGPAMYDRVRVAFPGLEVTTRCYAMTETCGPSAITYPDMCSLDAVKYSNGVPVPDMEVRITHVANGEDMPTGEMGEIRLRGPALFNGYLDMEAETRAAFDEQGWFRTGDLGHVDAAGLLYLGGRLKRMIKTGGENVSEREIEIFLEDKVEGVSLAQVVGIPDLLWGEAVIAFVECLPDATLNEEAVRAACKAGLANFKVPKRIFFVGGTDWPRNDVGKISKETLIAQTVADSAVDAATA